MNIPFNPSNVSLTTFVPMLEQVLDPCGQRYSRENSSSLAELNKAWQGFSELTQRAASTMPSDLPKNEAEEALGLLAQPFITALQNEHSALAKILTGADIERNREYITVAGESENSWYLKVQVAQLIEKLEKAFKVTLNKAAANLKTVGDRAVLKAEEELAKVKAEYDTVKDMMSSTVENFSKWTKGLSLLGKAAPDTQGAWFASPGLPC